MAVGARDCRCPVLIAAAEMHKLAEVGLELADADPATPLLIARLRAERGCAGMAADGGCRWEWTTMHRARVTPAADVPLLDGRTRRNPGQYL